MTEPTIDTIYGRFKRSSKRRLDIAYDSEHTEVTIFRKATALLGATHVIDVGANIGLYAIQSLGVPSVRSVTAIEASSATYGELAGNIALQTSPVQITAHCVAASASVGTQSFYEYGVMAGHNALVDTSFVGTTQDAQIATVATAPLDELIPDRQVTFAVKIDVEGHECEVLDGARDFLSHAKGFLQIEIVVDSNIAAVQQRLAGLGYEAVGFVKCDHYFLHRDLAALRPQFQDILWSEIRAGMVDLARLRRMRRNILRTANKVGAAAQPITQVARYAHDPVLVKS